MLVFILLILIAVAYLVPSTFRLTAGSSAPMAIPTSAQAIAAATFDALMQLDCDQPDSADDNCSDELQDANTAPTVTSVRREPGGLWRVVLVFRLSGGAGTVTIAETVG